MTDAFEEKILEKLDSRAKITKREFDKLCKSYRASDKPLSDYELPVIKLKDRFFQLYYTPTDGVSSKYPEEVICKKKKIGEDGYGKIIYYTWYKPKEKEILLLED